MQNNIFPPSQNYEEAVKWSQDSIKFMQTRYFQNQYEKSLNAKKTLELMKKQEKQKQLHLYNNLNENYKQDLNSIRQKKLLERSYLSNQYQEAINYQQEKSRYDKQIEKIVDKGSLVSPTWIRDANQERQLNRKNKQYYSQALDDHVRAQQAQKQNQKLRQNFMREKISYEAEKLLQKQYEYLEARHKQKSLFQKRQNQILGVQAGQSIDDDRFYLHDRESTLRKKEKQLYGQGLSAQIRKNEEKKRNSLDHSQIIQHGVYNPITNPIPFVYKNPNVLRMLSIA